MICAGYGEKIMSKTTTRNTEVRKATAVREPSRELSADELALVTGGRITNVRVNANGYASGSAPVQA
jgi:hypothetical protein